MDIEDQIQEGLIMFFISSPLYLIISSLKFQPSVGLSRVSITAISREFEIGKACPQRTMGCYVDIDAYTSESDPRSYEATKVVAKKAQNLFCFLSNSFSCFITGRITFTSVLYSHCIHI